MRFIAIATDYDNTLATEGRVSPASVAALERTLQSGRKVILVTGRLLPDLLQVFPEVGLCERVVANNGGVLYRPATQEHVELAVPIPTEFIDELRRRGVPDLAFGESIVSTVRPNELKVLEVIRDLGLEFQIIFNRDSVMVVPSGVNKATGLMVALKEMGLSTHNAVAIGDAENDHALLDKCEYAVAVANAVPMLKEVADWITPGPAGCGFAQLVHELVEHDLSAPAFSTERHKVLIGARDDGSEISVPVTRINLLLAGSSGSGKSTLATAVLERAIIQGYQCCIIDPEGDYEGFAGAVMFGTAQRGPELAEILTALEHPETNIAVNLVGLPLQDRPAFFLALLSAIQERRSKSGRPHCILVDETHHLLPRDWQPVRTIMAPETTGMVFITVQPDQIAKSVLNAVDVVVALGNDPTTTIARYCNELQIPVPEIADPELDHGEASLWNRRSTAQSFKVRIIPGETDRRRHRRKYAEGELPPDRSFFFRGPAGVLNLRAQNLIVFLQLANGVDEATWLHHLHRGDYSKWISEGIKDVPLADEIKQVEQQPSITAEQSRQLIREAIEKHYTVPIVA